MVDPTVENKLRSLGLMGNYQGYHCLVYSVHLIQADDTYLDMATMRAYAGVARFYALTAGAVDSGMRTAISLCCTRCQAQVSQMCGGKARPTVTEFLHGLVKQLAE